MNFKDNKAIYLQIADRLGDKILSGTLLPRGRFPACASWRQRLRSTLTP